ncbi:MAG: Uma2 family endonuclease, partial [Tepidiformaceae bacterium]
MVTKTRVSLAELLAMPECKPYLELIDGEVVQKSMPSYSHGTIVGELMIELGTYLRRTGEARAIPEMRHLHREDEWVFLPDISVTLHSRLTTPPADLRGPIEILPDLAIEVLSPDDQPGRVSQKIAHYMGSGVRLLWVVDPEDERIT